MSCNVITNPGTQEIHFEGHCSNIIWCNVMSALARNFNGMANSTGEAHFHLDNYNFNKLKSICRDLAKVAAGDVLYNGETPPLEEGDWVYDGTQYNN